MVAVKCLTDSYLILINYFVNLLLYKLLFVVQFEFREMQIFFILFSIGFCTRFSNLNHIYENIHGKREKQLEKLPNPGKPIYQ